MGLIGPWRFDSSQPHCGSRPGTSTPSSSACRGCFPGSTSGGPTSSACRRRSSPTTRSPTCSATSSRTAATRSPCTARRRGTASRSSRASGSRTSSRGFPARPASRTRRRARSRDLRRDPRRLGLRAERARAGLRPLRATSSTGSAALRDVVAARPEATVVCGDMNIAPTDDDVFDPEAYVGQTHVTPPEREALAELQALGLRDVVRDRWPGERVFSYWDYRAGMFHQDLGMRIDLVLASEPVADRVEAAWIDRQARKGKGPSDHAPVIVDLDEAPDGDIGPVVPPPSAPGHEARREEAAAVALARCLAVACRATAARASARPASSGSRADRACRPPSPLALVQVEQRLERVRRRRRSRRGGRPPPRSEPASSRP